MKINWKYILILALVVIVPTGTIWAAGYYAKKKLVDNKKPTSPTVDPSTIPDSDGSNDYNSDDDVSELDEYWEDIDLDEENIY